MANTEEIVFNSKYLNHKLDFDGVPVIEFNRGVFKTKNPNQIKALRNCEAFKRGVIIEVTEKEG